MQLARLTADVNVGDNYDMNPDQEAGSVYGQRNSNDQFRLDGIETTELTGNRDRLAPNPDAIEEFTVIKGLYPAEYGGVAGATINVAVRSGTNQFHGTAFEFLRNSDMDARNFFDTTGKAPDLKQNQFGGVIGGPLRKNKTFFFFSYDGLRKVDASVSTTVVPTAAQIAGDLSSLGKTIIDPSSLAPFPNNVIPATRINGISKALAAFWPAPNNPSVPSRDYISSSDEQVGPTSISGGWTTAFRAEIRLFSVTPLPNRTTIKRR